MWSIPLSPKGQLVVPKRIREEAGFDPSDRFIAVGVEDGVMFKKIDLDVQEEYEKLSWNVQQRFEQNDAGRAEVEDAVEWARE